jgi:tRNA dimethylallyltransferase
MLCPLDVSVRLRPAAPMIKKDAKLAYVIGLAIGDGGITNPNGRAYRLRITCDKKYPRIIKTAIEKYTLRLTTDSKKFIRETGFKKEKSGDQEKPKIIVVLGPTSSGKSDLAVELAREINGEIISADSRQVYRHLNIGSGKITQREMRGIPHHLLDVASPFTRCATDGGKVFTVADFQKTADKKVSEIVARGKVPIICGGTAFYIQSIVDGIVLPDVPFNKKLHARLEKMSLETLQKKLQKLDMERYKEIDTKNKIRLIRAIEIAQHLGKVPKIKPAPKYNALQIGLTLPQKELRDRIAKRLQKRLRSGMLNEARNLHDRGLSWKRMEEMGLEYRYMAQHLNEKGTKISHEKMCEEIQLRSQQFAKRQMTWFKRDSRIKWFNPKKDFSKISHEAIKFLNK